jgi:GR25 family glycosyltransferase involved in LPS biosynthesis
MKGDEAKYENTKRNICSMNLNINKYDAVVGRNIVDRSEYINYDGDLSAYTNGQVGCMLSHLNLIREFYLKYDEDYCLICEDDCEIYNPHNINIYQIIDNAPCNWEKIRLSYMLDPCTYNTMLRTSDTYLNISNEWVMVRAATSSARPERRE